MQKVLQTRKPDFVSTLSFIWDKHYCLPRSAYPGPSGGPPSSDPIHGISAPKVYPSAMLPLQTVGSYPTFSPFPASLPSKGGRKTSSYFLWHCLFPVARNPAINRWVALSCPDFPPRLSQGDSSVCSIKLNAS